MVRMFQPYVNERAIELVNETLRSGWIGEGPRVQEFEEALNARFGFAYSVALNSGTSALRLALAMAGVRPMDEVITVAQTCTATNTPILEQFARPVFADICYDTGNVNPGDIEHRITEKTKAIECVHWGGYPCEMDVIMAIGHEHDLPVVVDGAHALGATYHGRPVGTIADYTMFSFQAIKQLTTGDGGLLTVNMQEQYDEARRRRWFGIDRRNRVKQVNGYAYWNQSEVGYKMHMNDVAASIGLGNLEDIDEILALRWIFAHEYREGLTGVPGVTLTQNRDDRESGNWLFTIHVERRDNFCRMMTAKGIETSVCHIRNDMHDVFGPRRDDLPNTDKWHETAICLPLHNHMTIGDVHEVIDAIKEGW